jgi:hypothetical protein
MSDNEFDFGAEFAAFGDELKGVAYEGEYQMRVQNMKPGMSPKGKAMFRVTLAFTSGPYKAKGKTVDDALYWSPESDTAARIFAANLKVLGAPQEWIMSERPSPQQIAQRCIGNVIDVRLRPDEFNGQPTTRVSYQRLVSASATSQTGKATAQATAVSLDDEEDAAAAAAGDPDEADVDTVTGEVKEPATVGAAGTDGTENPWG